MSRQADIAYGFRWLLLLAGLAFTGVSTWWLIWWFIWPEGPWGGLLDAGWQGIFVLGPLLLAQWWFLRPRRGWRIQIIAEGRPMKLAVVSAGFIAALLTAGFIFVFIEIINLYEALDYYWDGWGTIGFLLFVWAAWGFAFYHLWRHRDHYQWMAAILRRLVIGSVVEMLVSVGVYAWNPHNQSCECSRGSFWGIAFSATVLIWAFGPGIFLLFYWEKYRREKFQLCRTCGYDLTGTRAAGRTECPECGAAVRPARPPASQEASGE